MTHSAKGSPASALGVCSGESTVPSMQGAESICIACYVPLFLPMQRIVSAFKDEQAKPGADPHCVEVKWYERRTNLETATKWVGPVVTCGAGELAAACCDPAYLSSQSTQQLVQHSYCVVRYMQTCSRDG